MQLDRYEVAEGTLYLIDPELELQICEPFVLPRVPGTGEKKESSLEGLEVIRQHSDEGHLQQAYLQKEGRFHGQHLQFHPCGRIKAESFYQEGKLHGLSYFTSLTGTVLSLTWFYEGFPVGKSKQFYRDGSLYSLQRYRKGKLHGKQEYFYENSSPKTVLFYQEGDLHGEIELFWPSGQLKRKSGFQNGLREGLDTIWSVDGIVLDEGGYVKGASVGTEKKRYSTGVLKEEKQHHAPGQFDHRHWDELGRLVYEGVHLKDSIFQETKVQWPEGASQIRQGRWDGSRVLFAEK